MTQTRESLREASIYRTTRALWEYFRSYAEREGNIKPNWEKLSAETQGLLIRRIEEFAKSRTWTTFPDWMSEDPVLQPTMHLIASTLLMPSTG
jgi:hypothetical protein